MSFFNKIGLKISSIFHQSILILTNRKKERAFFVLIFFKKIKKFYIYIKGPHLEGLKI